MLTVGSLFSGIGGIDLGLERAGMKVLWQVEIDEWCRRVLAKHWPDVERFADVREVGAHNLAPVDLLAGGFPCQDISIAGRGAGLAGERSGLWGDFDRIIRALRPRYVLVENVPALRVRGLGTVLADLAEGGYDTEWDGIPAAAVGAPHLRDRLWLVATRTEQRRPLADADDGRPLDAVQAGRNASGDGGAPMADSDSLKRRGRSTTRRVSPAIGARGSSAGTRTVADPEGIPIGTGLRDGITSGQRGRRLGDRSSEVAEPTSGGRGARRSRGSARVGEGLPEQALPDADGAGRGEQRGAVAEFAEYAATQRDRWWSSEPNVGRVAHGIPSRVDRLRGLGNAGVPQVVEWIGRRIVEAEAE